MGLVRTLEGVDLDYLGLDGMGWDGIREGVSTMDVPRSARSLKQNWGVRVGVWVGCAIMRGVGEEGNGGGGMEGGEVMLDGWRCPRSSSASSSSFFDDSCCCDD